MNLGTHIYIYGCSHLAGGLIIDTIGPEARRKVTRRKVGWRKVGGVRWPLVRDVFGLLVEGLSQQSI